MAKPKLILDMSKVQIHEDAIAAWTECKPEFIAQVAEILNVSITAIGTTLFRINSDGTAELFCDVTLSNGDVNEVTMEVPTGQWYVKSEN